LFKLGSQPKNEVIDEKASQLIPFKIKYLCYTVLFSLAVPARPAERVLIGI